MISHKLLSILCCPETKQPLNIADSTIVDKLSALQAAGQLKNISNTNVLGPVTGALIREDQKILYIIREDIPVLLVEEGVLMSQVKDSEVKESE